LNSPTTSAVATDGEMPPGYSHDQWETDLGPFSPDRFDRLADSLSRWQVQLGSGMTIAPVEPVSPGLTFALAFGLAGRLGYVMAAGRVVYVTAEADRRGFAYGTLPGHPERGEEAFHLVRQGRRCRSGFGRSPGPGIRWRGSERRSPRLCSSV